MGLQGYIHQLESFGCADGPGSRFIIFFSGCPLHSRNFRADEYNLAYLRL